MDRTEIDAYTASERLAFGRRVHITHVVSKNRIFNCRWSKSNEPQSGYLKKALNMASSPLKDFQQEKRRYGCHDRGFRLMRLILS